MKSEPVSLEEAKGIVAKVDAGPYSLGEKIAYLSGYLMGTKGYCDSEAENYLVETFLFLNILCNGGIIANVPVRARGKFDIKPYRALDLIPAGASRHVED